MSPETLLECVTRIREIDIRYEYYELTTRQWKRIRKRLDRAYQRFLAEWAEAIVVDNRLYQSEQISHDEYWARVHSRDDELGQMQADDRIAVNQAMRAMVNHSG